MSTQDVAAEPSHTDLQSGSRRPTLSDVARAYQLFLGREIESASTAGFHISNAPDLWDLVGAVSACPEARYRRASSAAADMRAVQGQLSPELDASPTQLDALRRLVIDAWNANGLGRYDQSLRRNDEHFAVRSARWNLEKTLERGKTEADELFGILGRLGWKLPVTTATVLGVQAFRMLGAAPDLVGIELLESDLTLVSRAPTLAGGAGIRSISAKEYANDLPKTDLFYSVAALQYAPPPLLLDMLRRCLDSVRPGGAAVFQVPCFLHDYHFGVEDYLYGEARDTGGELHCVPQSRILSLLSEEGFRLLEVSPDERIENFGFSYFFVAEKIGALSCATPRLRNTATPEAKKDRIVNQAMSRCDLEQAVQAREWFHRIDLGHGLVTQGDDDSPYKLTALRLPQDLSGKTVLDIGAWDGFFSFECERRGGAKVVASDSFCWRGQGVFDGGGFRLAHAALGSCVEPLNASVEQLDPAVHGTFDYVLFLGVLYHAPDPLGYLAKVRALCRETAIIETVVDALDVDRPALIFYPGAALNGDGSNFFGPNEAAVIAMCKEVGFSRVEVANRFYYENRMVFHAHV